MSSGNEFDYVIIGAESAGCTLVNRLTRDRDVHVLAIQAGGSDRGPLVSVPVGVNNGAARWSFVSSGVAS